jgi:hypothetical protein
MYISKGVVMKKLLLCMALISAMPLLGVINEWDSSLSPEERAHRRMLNQTRAEGYREHNEKAQAAWDKEVAQATHNFLGKVIGMKNIHERDAELTKFIEEMRNIKLKNQNFIAG